MILWKLLTPVITLAVCFALLEAGARVLLPPAGGLREAEADPEPIRYDPLLPRDSTVSGLFGRGDSGRIYPRPGKSMVNTGGFERDVLVRTNSLGLRGGEPPPRTPGETRILFLGDSIVFSDYVSEEHSLPAKLDTALSAGGRNVTVFNGGVPGASLSDTISRYFGLREALDHDVVLLGLYLNDAQDSRRTRILRTWPTVPWSRFLSFASETIGLRRARRQLVALGADPNSDEVRAEIGWQGPAPEPTVELCRSQADVDAWVAWAAADFGQGFTRSAWARLEASLQLLEEAVRGDGRRFAIVLFPVRFQATSPYDERRPQEAFAEVCGKLGVPCMDPLPLLRAEWPRSKKPLLFDLCHYTVEGHDLLAPALAAWLTESGVVK